MKKFNNFLNEDKIYLDGGDSIDWNILTTFVMQDPSVKGVSKKDIQLVLTSVSKFLIDEHWAMPGAFPDIQDY